jgi:hypothetical protein
MSEEFRPPEPATFEIDGDTLQGIVARVRCTPQALEEAIARVGPNPAAVETYLSATNF